MAEQENTQDGGVEGTKAEPSTVVVIRQNAESTNSEIENMEVHKHPHHITHKKKWREYFLEFFMIFVAVFLASWQRT